jgi:hypothetical protein
MPLRRGHSLSRVEILDRVVLLAEKAGRDPYEVASDYRRGVETSDRYITDAYALLALLPGDHAVFCPPPAPRTPCEAQTMHNGKC